jgi:flavin reductase (DIM6/NTAB) family NADH-FMN oxidoreductase RutF
VLGRDNNPMLDEMNQVLFLVTSRHRTQRSAMIVTWITKASLGPKRQRLILVLSPRNLTTRLLLKSGVFGLSLLGSRQLSWVEHFGARSGSEIDKFKGIEREFSTSGQSGLPRPKRAISSCEARVESVVSTGDRLIVVAKVNSTHRQRGGTKPDRALRMSDLRRLSPSIRSRLAEKLAADAKLDSKSEIERVILVR